MRALRDEGLLPRIISGTSGGAIISAIVCCRCDDELEEVLCPSFARRMDACEGSICRKLARVLRGHTALDVETSRQRMARLTMGDTTFLEAFTRTGPVTLIVVQD